MLWVMLLIFYAVPIGASLFLARRNLKLGRGDRKNAFRMAVFVFTSTVAAWFAGATHVLDANNELNCESCHNPHSSDVEKLFTVEGGCSGCHSN